ncbi:MAG: NUDIX domain-containing protein [Alphaproteobacteria bacterium]
MPAKSAGLLLYRRDGDTVRVLLVRPGGPFWQKRDAGAWSVPKGEYDPGEDPETVARREFEEELGVGPPPGDARYVGEVVQAGGKRVVAYAIEGDLDVSAVESNSFEMEWPPRSGRRRSFPEVDRAEWFPLDVAREKILPAQCPLLDYLAEIAAGKR